MRECNLIHIELHWAYIYMPETIMLHWAYIYMPETIIPYLFQICTFLSLFFRVKRERKVRKEREKKRLFSMPSRALG